MNTTDKRMERRDRIEKARTNTNNLDEIKEAVREEEDTPDSVSLIASGYEWNCPKCDTLNHEIETKEQVTCKDCGAIWPVDEYNHADG